MTASSDASGPGKGSRDGDGDGQDSGLSHPRHGLDTLLGHGVRFSVVAALAGVENAEFAAVRDSVEIRAQSPEPQPPPNSCPAALA